MIEEHVEIGGNDPGVPDGADDAGESQGPDGEEDGDAGEAAHFDELAAGADFGESEAVDGGTGEECEEEVDAKAEGDDDEQAVEAGDAEGEALVVGDDEDDGGEEGGGDGGEVSGLGPAADDGRGRESGWRGGVHRRPSLGGGFWRLRRHSCGSRRAGRRA